MRKIFSSVYAAVLTALASVSLISGCESADVQSSDLKIPVIESTNTQSSSEVPQSSDTSGSEGPDVMTEDDFLLPDVAKNTSYAIMGGQTMRVSGERIVSGTLIVCEGASLIIENDGLLIVEGLADIAGEAVLEGKLDVRPDAAVSGPGVLRVKNRFDDINCEGSVTVKLDAPEPVIGGGAVTVGGILIVNKRIALAQDYGSELSANDLLSEVKDALQEMRKASGFTMRVTSGYRSFETQRGLFQYYASLEGIAAAQTYSAHAGYSEHQTGLAADITGAKYEYADTAEGKWLAANCYKYGFIIRYPEDKTDVTGYVYEPWHIRYLGKSNAKLVHDSGLCLEEFLEVDNL